MNRFFTKLKFNYLFFLALVFFSSSTLLSNDNTLEKTQHLQQLELTLGGLVSQIKERPATEPISPPIEPLSFAEWYAKCKALPLLRKIGVNFDYKAIEWEDLDKIIDEFFAVNTKLLQDSDKWIEDPPPASDEFFTQLQEPLQSIKPFVQKLIVKPQTTIAFHGDFHGDIHSMIEYIKRLNAENYMNGFLIKDPNFYLVFLGDYVDRGNYGTEVWYTLMRLKTTNPHNVIIIRGNHEDPGMTQQFGFQAEFMTKFKNFAGLNKFQRIFDFLPVALYLGTGTEALKNYLLCIHGGLEKKFNPADLLSSPTSLLYKWLKFSTTQSFPSQLGNIGFLWNDFHIIPTAKTTYQHGRGYQYNERDTISYFREQSSPENGYVIKGIFRAHQHTGNPEDLLMQAMLKGKGVAKLWPDSQHQDKSLWDDIVCTFLVGADSGYGQAHKYNWDGFGILTTAEKFEDWKLEMLVNDIVPTTLRQRH